MRRLLFAFLALVPMLAIAQVTWNKTDPPSHPPIPAPKSFNWDLDGHHAVEFTWEYGPEVGMEGYYPESCRNDCRGKVHLLHEQCDTSCDRTCSDLHRQTISPYVQLEKIEFFEDPGRFDHVFERECGKVGVGPKYPLNQVAWGMVEQMRKPIESDKNLQVDVKWNHFAKGPCEQSIRCHVGYEVPVTLVWEVYRFDTAPDGRQVRVGGGKHRTLLAKVLIPQDGVASETHDIYCQCSIVKESLEQATEEHYVPLPPIKPIVEEKRTGAVIRESTSGTAVCDSQELQKFDFNVVCESMNECVVSCTNPTNEQQTFIICPGVVLVCLDNGYQDMCCTTPIRLVVPAMSSASESVQIVRFGPSACDYGDRTSGKGRLLCMNMDLKEPNAKVAYRIGGGASPGLRALAQLTYGSSIRGTQDQVRMWIATDAATFDKCASVLFPRPKEGLYADCLFEAFGVARLNGSDPKFAACFDPKLVAGAAKPRTTAWLVPRLAARAPDKLAAWVNGNHAAFAPLFTESGMRLGIPHAARLARELCESSNAGVRKAGLNFLLKAIPEASRKEFADAGGLAGGGLLLMQGTAEEAKLALEVFEAYKSAVSILYLRNANAALPKETKDRAENLLKALG
jgi:hypothetical protein